MTISFRTFLSVSSKAFSRLRGGFISHFSLLQIGKYDQKMFLTVSRDLSTDKQQRWIEHLSKSTWSDKSLKNECLNSNC